MKHIFWGIATAIILIIGIWILYGQSQVQTPIVENPGPTATSTPNTPNPSPTPTRSGYTMADVAKHAGASSCWTAINGKVYDVTRFINQHPGGSEAILSLCGTDGSSAFNDQHGGQRRPEQELASFFVANLSE